MPLVRLTTDPDKKLSGPPADDAARAILAPWPVRRPPDWRRYVNRPETAGELDAIRRAIVRGSPYGGPRWTKRAATEFGLETTLRPRGRPKKGS